MLLIRDSTFARSLARSLNAAIQHSMAREVPELSEEPLRVTYPDLRSIAGVNFHDNSCHVCNEDMAYIFLCNVF